MAHGPTHEGELASVHVPDPSIPHSLTWPRWAKNRKLWGVVLGVGIVLLLVFVGVKCAPAFLGSTDDEAAAKVAKSTKTSGVSVPGRAKAAGTTSDTDATAAVGGASGSGGTGGVHFNIYPPTIHYNIVDSDGRPRGGLVVERIGLSDPWLGNRHAMPADLGIVPSIPPNRVAGGLTTPFTELGSEFGRQLNETIDAKVKPVKEQVERVETKVGQLETKINEVGESTKEILKRLGGPTPAASSSTAPPGTAPAPALGSSTPLGGTPPAGSSATLAPTTPAPAVTPSAPGSSAGAAPAPSAPPPPATPSAPGATPPAPPTPAPTPAPTPDPNAGTAATSGGSTS